MKKLIKFLSFIFIAAFLLTGCGKNGVNSSGEELSDRTLRITMIGTAVDDPISIRAKQGAEAEIEKLMNRYPKLNIELDWKAPVTQDHMQQSSLLVNAAYDGTDMIIVSCLDSIVMKEAIHMSKQLDIPVITYDSDIPSSERLAYIGPDHREIGKRLLIDMAGLSEEGKIAIMAGSERQYKHSLQIRGINEAIKNFAGLNIVETVYHPENTSASIEALKNIKSEHEDLVGVIMLGNWVFTDEAVDADLFDNIHVVMIDAFPEQFPYIENETIDACVGQATYKYGSQAMKLAVENLYLEKEIDEINTMKTIPVTVRNLGGWSRQFRAWGQDGIDEKYLKM